MALAKPLSTSPADRWRSATPNLDAMIADIWLDALTAIQRRGRAGTISQALDDIEAAFERADALERTASAANA